MKSHASGLRRSRLRQFFRVALRFWSGQSRLRAWGLTLAVLLFVAAQLGAAVGINSWNRLFFDALEKRDLDKIWTAVGWLPLIGLWFGSGDLSKVIVVSLSAFYPAVLYTYEGLNGVEARMLEVGRLYRLTPWQTFWRIRWPSALPSIFTGLLQSVAFAWIATIGVELLFPTGFGLGTVMQHGQLQARLDIVVVCIAVVGLTGFAINLLVARLSRHALRWRPVRS